MAAIEVGDSVRIGKRRGNEALLGHKSRPNGLPAGSSELVPFSCECHRVSCQETVWMVESDFWKVAHGNGYALVAPGHATTGDRIIARTAGYELTLRTN